MKKFMCGFLVGVMVLACAPTAFAKSKITVNVDKEELVFDVEPQIINDRLMVPMRVIFEKLNANVEYIEAEKAVLAQKGNRVICFIINADYMAIQDGNSEIKYFALDAPATIINGRTLVPARAVAESFGCGVSWNGDTKTVQINTDGSIAKPEQKKEKWVLKKVTHYWDGSVIEWSDYEYDSVGNKKKETYHRYFEGQLFEYKYDYKVENDSKGNVKKETSYNSDGSIYASYEYEYDSKGNITKCTIRYPDGTEYETNYKYDSMGKRISPYQSAVEYYKYEYDNVGNLTKMTAYEYTTGHETSRVEYEYTKITKK